MQAIIDHIGNIKSSIEKSAGAIVIIELKLRLLAETNPLFRGEVYKKINASKRDVNNRKRNEYWNCELSILCSAIESVFELTINQKKVINRFKEPRDKTLHGDFVALFEILGISQDGHEILSSGKRNQLIWADKEQAIKGQFLKQAILRFENNGTVEELRSLCVDFDAILNKLLTGGSLKSHSGNQDQL